MLLRVQANKGNPFPDRVRSGQVRASFPAGLARRMVAVADELLFVSTNTQTFRIARCLINSILSIYTEGRWQSGRMQEGEGRKTPQG